MSATTTTSHIILHLEWWDHRTGREVLLQAMRAARPYVHEEGVHVYHPSWLDVTGVDAGEAELWFTATLADDRIVTPRFIKELIVNSAEAGTHTRVKMIGPIAADIAHGTLEEFWAYLDEDEDEG